MKRRRTAFPFLALLPEMRGEVRTWLDVPDRAALARVCHALALEETRLPALPPQWAFMWTSAASADADVRSSTARALRELVAFGVSRWPNAYRVAKAFFVRDVGGAARGLSWMWRDGEVSLASLEWDFGDADWSIWVVFDDDDGEVPCVTTLAALPADVVALWRDFVARADRVPPTDYGPGEVSGPDAWYSEDAA